VREKEGTGCGQEEEDGTRQMRKKKGTGCKEKEGDVIRGWKK
jgi:hypothetical protein